VLSGASAVKLVAHVVLWRSVGTGARPLTELPVARWFRAALPFLALALLATIYYRLGIVALHALRGPEETAPFAAAYRVSDAAAVLAGVGFASVSPVLSRAHRDRPHEVVALWRKLVLRAAIVIVPAMLCVSLASEWIAGTLFGARYEESGGEVLRLLAPGMVFLMLQNLTAAVVFMSDDLGPVLALTIVNLVVTIGLTVWLAEAHGATGAAIAASVAEFVSFATFAVLVQRRFGGSSSARVSRLQSPAP
jgi:O-antigen/teichoic acid export membrane protein